jgi:hypothetical protein
MTPQKIDRMPMRTVKLFKPRVAHRFFCLVTMLMLASCAHQKTYVAPDLGPEQTAILEAKVPIWIVSIDGEKVSSLSLHDSAFVKLLPGPHIIEVTFQQSDMRHVMVGGYPYLRRSRTYVKGPLKLRMLAQAGCKYIVDYKVEDDKNSKQKTCKVWIVKLE